MNTVTSLLIVGFAMIIVVAVIAMLAGINRINKLETMIAEKDEEIAQIQAINAKFKKQLTEAINSLEKTSKEAVIRREQLESLLNMVNNGHIKVQ